MTARVRCIRLADLPPPPPGKSGWPWTVEAPQLPTLRPDGTSWPRISIVTPSYNQGLFIEETIRSVLLQGYPDLEYIVIDGGSTDGAVDIIRKYAPWLTHWTSEPDRGQAHAINKGFVHATGAIGAYLNSDDYYLAGALPYAAQSFSRLGWDLLIGRSDEHYRPTWYWLRRSWWKHKLTFYPRPFVIGSKRYGISQESTFWSLEKFRDRRFDETLQFCLDVDWYCRIARGARIALSPRKIGHFREHPDSKTARLQHVRGKEHAEIDRQQAELGNSEHLYPRVLSAVRLRMPLLLVRALLSGFGEFCYRHPP